MTIHNILSIQNKPLMPVDNKKTLETAPAHESFANFLKKSIEEVNQSQIQSDKITEKLVRGENVDLHQVMITSQKASISMQTTMEIRNKVIEAYQEVMRMPM